MAKPIRATPELRGQEAKSFVKRMLHTEKAKITQKEIELAEAIAHFPL